MSSEMITPEPIQDHLYWDPRKQEIPKEVLGVPTSKIAGVCEALGTWATLSPYSHEMYPYHHAAHNASIYHRDALRLVPLVDRIRDGESLEAEDVRPYRKSIKRMTPSGVRALDRLAVMTSVVGVGIPARIALNQRIEQEFIDRSPELIEKGLEKARANLGVIEPHVEFLEQFDNPQRQVQDEFRFVINGIQRHAKAASSPRSVSSRSAAEGIRREIDELFASAENTESLPILSYAVLDRIKKKPKLPDREILEIGAPEVMRVLNSALPYDERDNEFISQIEARPHPKRKLAQTFSTRLYSNERSGIRMVSGLIYAIPTSGEEVRRIYENVKAYVAE